MRLHKTKIALAVLAASLSASSWADIKIGVIGPYTGASQSMGIALKEGAALAAAEINGRGGLLGGEKIVLVQYDDQAKPAVGEEMAKAAAEKEKVVAALGFANTGVAAKAGTVFQKANIPLIVTTASGAGLTELFAKEPRNYIFRTSLHDALQTEMVVHEALDVMKYKRVAIFADSTAYGTGGLEQLLSKMKQRGVEPVLIERFPIGQTDFEDAAMRTRKANADVVLSWTLSPENAGIRNSFNRVGSRIPMIGSWTLAMQQFGDMAGYITNGTKAPVAFALDTPRAKGQEFIKNYKLFTKRSQLPSNVSAAQAYDSMYLMAMAINQAKSTDPQKIHAALENLEGTFEGAVMTYNKPFSKTNHEAIQPSSGMKMTVWRNGVVVQLSDKVAPAAPAKAAEKDAKKK